MNQPFTPDLAASLLGRALRRGGDFAEVFVEEKRSLSLRLDDRKIEDVVSGEDWGASIRVVRGDTTLFGYTDSLEEKSLLELADRLASGMASEPSLPASLHLIPVESVHEVRTPPAEVAAADKAAVLRGADESARGRSREVRQVGCGYSENRQRVWIANSRGAFAADDRTRVVLSISVVAARDGIIQTGHETMAHHGGYELIAEGDVSGLAVKVVDKAVAMLGARPSPAGRMPVVLANGFGGVLFHEACGHGLEADFIVKRTSIWEGKRDQQVAQPLVTAYDDGASAGMWGSAAFDDEGSVSQKTAVIEEGVLRWYLTDVLRGERLGLDSTGNGRRQSFRHLPYPRMTNTYIAPGTATPQELISDTKRAFYAKSLAGGQVDPATGDFVFGVSEGYLIEGGKVGPAVRGATLIGNGAEVLWAIDAIANDLDIKAGMCGKEGQAVPVGTGQPTLRLRELTVGGTSVHG